MSRLLSPPDSLSTRLLFLSNLISHVFDFLITLCPNTQLFIHGDIFDKYLTAVIGQSTKEGTLSLSGQFLGKSTYNFYWLKFS